jgi:hypothetical protein
MLGKAAGRFGLAIAVALVITACSRSKGLSILVKGWQAGRLRDHFRFHVRAAWAR